MKQISIKVLEEFASRMSTLLFDMRLDDIGMSDLMTTDDREVPKEYVDKILDDKNHCTAIKEKIRLSVLEGVTNNNSRYKWNGEKYVYTSNCYDHAYAMDMYIEDQFIDNNPIMAYRWVCDHCGSDKVQTKVWTRPNNNFELPDEIFSEDLNDNFCEDCDENRTLSKVEMNVRTKVIGFQVNLSVLDEMHPEMEASFCVYNLSQANKMVATDPNDWQLLAIYDDTIEEPTMMFEGDPRE